MKLLEGNGIKTLVISCKQPDDKQPESKYDHIVPE